MRSSPTRRANACFSRQATSIEENNLPAQLSAADLNRSFGRGTTRRVVQHGLPGVSGGERECGPVVADGGGARLVSSLAGGVEDGGGLVFEKSRLRSPKPHAFRSSSRGLWARRSKSLSELTMTPLFWGAFVHEIHGIDHRRHSGSVTVLVLRRPAFRQGRENLSSRLWSHTGIPVLSGPAMCFLLAACNSVARWSAIAAGLGNDAFPCLLGAHMIIDPVALL